MAVILQGSIPIIDSISGFGDFVVGFETVRLTGDLPGVSDPQTMVFIERQPAQLASTNATALLPNALLTTISEPDRSNILIQVFQANQLLPGSLRAPVLAR
jgi:hypothetical protein